LDRKYLSLLFVEYYFLKKSTQRIFFSPPTAHSHRPTWGSHLSILEASATTTKHGEILNIDDLSGSKERLHVQQRRILTKLIKARNCRCEK
jgi:hypothetical protein